MPDRILRDEIWLSDRFLDLPTDAARLSFLRFVGLADDFGNFEGGPRRLFRILHACTQIKTESAATEILVALIEADLIRRYEIEGRELYHIPRFRSHRQYLSRRFPPSPWCNKNMPLGKEKRIKNSGLAKNLDATSLPRSNLVAEGVGVGVGVGELQKQNQRRGAASAAPFVVPDWIPKEHWDAYEEMRNKIRKPMTDAARRMAVMKLGNLNEQGHPPNQVLRQSVFNGWQGLFPIKEVKA